jgi:hypothetical protein
MIVEFAVGNVLPAIIFGGIIGVLAAFALFGTKPVQADDIAGPDTIETRHRRASE